MPDGNHLAKWGVGNIFGREQSMGKYQKFTAIMNQKRRNIKGFVVSCYFLANLLKRALYYQSQFQYFYPGNHIL